MFYYVLGGVHRPDIQYYYYYLLLLLIQQKKIGGHNYSVLLFLHSVGLPSGLDFLANILFKKVFRLYAPSETL